MTVGSCGGYYYSSRSSLGFWLWLAVPRICFFAAVNYAFGSCIDLRAGVNFKRNIACIEILEYVIGYEINTVYFFVIENWFLVHSVALSTRVHNSWLMLELISHKDVLAKIFRQIFGKLNFNSKENFLAK